MRSTALALVLTSTLVAGCAGPHGEARTPPAPVAPTTGTIRAQCIVADRQGQLIVQPGTVAPTRPQTLLDVSLTDPVNLTVIQRDVVPFAGQPGARGVIRNYPPLRHADIADGLAHWAQRRPLAGLDLDRTDSTQAVLVSVRLTDPTRPGHLDGVGLTTSTGATAWASPLLVEPHRDLTLCTVDEVNGSLDWVP